MVRKTEESIKGLPKAPSEDPLSEIMNLLGLFVRDLERHLEGTPEEGGLLQRIRPSQEQFRREIKATAPDFRPMKSDTQSPSRFSGGRSQTTRNKAVMKTMSKVANPHLSTLPEQFM